MTRYFTKVCIIALLLLPPSISESKDNTDSIYNYSGWWLSGAIGKFAQHGDGFTYIVSDPYVFFHHYTNEKSLYDVSIWHESHRKLSLGFTMSYEQTAGTWDQRIYDPHIPTWGGSTRSESSFGNFKCQILTIAALVSMDYTRSSNNFFKTYCLLSIGGGYRNEVDTYAPEYYYSTFKGGISSLGNEMQFNNNNYKLRFQFTPFGFSLGRKLRGYAEFGLGYRGLINVGITGKL